MNISLIINILFADSCTIPVSLCFVTPLKHQMNFTMKLNEKMHFYMHGMWWQLFSGRCLSAGCSSLHRKCCCALYQWKSSLGVSYCGNIALPYCAYLVLSSSCHGVVVAKRLSPSWLANQYITFLFSKQAYTSRHIDRVTQKSMSQQSHL